MRLSRDTVAPITFAVGLMVGLGVGVFASRATSEGETSRHPSARLAPRPASTANGRSAPASVRLSPGPGPSSSETASPTRPLSEIAPAPHVHAPGAPHDGCAPAPASELDEKALAAAIATFKEGTDLEAVMRDAALLGASGGKPAVEAARAVLAAGGTSPLALGRRAAAFMLIAAQEDPAGRAPALEVLARENDADLRLSALSALGSSRGASPEEAASVSAQLTTVAERDADPEARRRAVRALARWRTSDAEVGTILRLLESDPDENVRGACCFALEDERVRSPAAISTLARVVSDRGAAPSVRELAAEALKRLGPLDPVARRALAAWEQDAP